MGTWDLGARGERRGDVWDARTCGSGMQGRGEVKYRESEVNTISLSS